MKANPMTCCDYYKLGHMTMDVPGVQKVVATWTPRHHNYTPGCTYTVNFGLQWVIQSQFKEFFAPFFAGDFEYYADDFRRKVVPTFNPIYIEPIVEAFRKLHTLGYLPIEVWSVPEGYLIPDGCPIAMIFNTVDGFGWLPQFLEDRWSLSAWLPSTSATTAFYRREAASFFFKSCSDDASAVRRLCGDFSMRGMTSHEAAAISGAGHLLSFDRTATIDANSILEEYYGADLVNQPCGFGTPSLEHSVVEKGVAYFREKILSGALIDDDKYGYRIKQAALENWEMSLVAEMCFLLYLLTEVQPSGVFTYVSDTYDYWGVIDKILPAIGDVITNRDGKLVIRPDSGDPVKIILGDPDAVENSPQRVGTLRALEYIFGSEHNSKGMRVLNNHIGLIYGDAITAQRQSDILNGMADLGFAPDNIALGIGAYTYQYVTRDTRGFAIKATDCFIEGIGEIPIFKQPKTDLGKRSQKGAVVVIGGELPNEIDHWVDHYHLDEALNDPNQLMFPIFRNGETMNTQTVYEIRDRLHNGRF